MREPIHPNRWINSERGDESAGGRNCGTPSVCFCGSGLRVIGKMQEARRLWAPSPGPRQQPPPSRAEGTWWSLLIWERLLVFEGGWHGTLSAVSADYEFERDRVLHPVMGCENFLPHPLFFLSHLHCDFHHQCYFSLIIILVCALCYLLFLFLPSCYIIFGKNQCWLVIDGTLSLSMVFILYLYQ